ncbi:MAG TPA: acyl-CoA dehydrogenase family protein, partial [Phycicoccus sp.]|nr:acyl-CoA dehydrogenase family protein [Phycicoccus sp.]
MFELSQDHEDFRKVVKEFAAAEVEPHVAQWDRDKHFPSDLVGKMGDLGL